MKESTLAVYSPLLTRFAVDYPRLERGFVAESLFRVLPVNQYAGQYRVFQKNYRLTDDRTGLRSVTPEIDEAVASSEGTFYCDLHALKAFIPEKEIKIAQDPLDVRIAKTEKIMRDILINQEKRVKALIDAGVSGAASKDWSPDATSIESDIWTARETVKEAIGVRPNTIVMGDDVYTALLQNTTLRGLWSVIPGLRAMETTQFDLRVLFSVLFNIDNLVVASAFEDTAKRNQTSVYSEIWKQSALVCYVEPGRLTTETLTLGVTFRYEDVKTYTWINNDPRGEYVKNEVWQDERLVCASAGYLFSSITIA